MDFKKSYREKGNATYLLIVSLGILAIVAFFAISSYAPFKSKLFGILYPKQSSFASGYAMGVVKEVSITSGSYPSWVSVNSKTNLLYVTNFDAKNNPPTLGNPSVKTDTVSVIDIDSRHSAFGTVITTIPVGLNPRSISLNLNTNLAYVANSGSYTVSVIDINPNNYTYNAVIHTIQMGARSALGSPWHIWVNPNTNLAYITFPSGSAVVVYDVDPANPHNTLYAPVSALQLTATESTTVPSDFPHSAPFFTGQTPYDVIGDPLTNRIFVTVGTTGNKPTVFVYDGNNLNKQKATTPTTIYSVNDVWAIPDREAFNPITNTLYVAVQFAGSTPGTTLPIGTLVAINMKSSSAIVTPISIATVPDGVDVDTTNNLVFVGAISSPYQLWEIDGVKNNILNFIIPSSITDQTLQPAPLGVAVNFPYIYTANAGANTISIICETKIRSDGSCAAP